MKDRDFWQAWCSGFCFGLGIGVVATAIYYLALYPCIVP